MRHDSSGRKQGQSFLITSYPEKLEFKIYSSVIRPFIVCTTETLVKERREMWSRLNQTKMQMISWTMTISFREQQTIDEVIQGIEEKLMDARLPW